ncbi:MAG: hypothetical protein CMN21_05405 [Rubinisphaera sp.]|nr:hypothetical protein [Rubinisphaera sp.]|tara:strand:- start:7070 stop:7681 length:612 start_codon:yes stop_codon:yes gene_type:complete
MMNRPEPPSGHQFRIEENDSGTTLAWKHRPNDPIRFLFGGYYFVFGIIFIFMSYSDFTRAFNNQENTFDIFRMLGPFIFLIFFPLIMLLAYLFLKRNRLEKIAFKGQELIFQDGKGPISVINFHWLGKKRHNFNPISFVFSKAKSYSFNRSDVDRIILEGFGQQQRLRFDDGAVRVEIGEYLREPEREWLFEQIQQWRSAGDN